MTPPPAGCFWSFTRIRRWGTLEVQVNEMISHCVSKEVTKVIKFIEQSVEYNNLNVAIINAGLATWVVGRLSRRSLYHLKTDKTRKRTYYREIVVSHASTLSRRADRTTDVVY